MTNVTGGSPAGYRFLPHMRFAKKIIVRLPYRDDAIPSGASARDLQTFFFDETSHEWRPLKRVRVDTQRRQVVSFTSHFTDMITAAVTVPDHPDPASFKPTRLTDTEPADPGSRIGLVSPPAASNLGDAR